MASTFLFRLELPSWIPLDGFEIHFLPASFIKLYPIMAPYSPFAIPSLLSTVRSQLPSNIIIKHQQYNKRSGNPKSGCPTASLSLKPNRCYFLNFPSVAFLSFRTYVCSCAYVNVCVLVTVLVMPFFARFHISEQDHWPDQRRQENVFTQKQMQ